MEVKIKKLVANAIIPTKGSEEAAGFDLYAYIANTSQTIVIFPHQTKFINTGLSIEIPKSCFGAIYARSGLACKEYMRPANCVGVIDSDYRGEIMIALHNDSEETKTITNGQRIAQMIIQPYLYTTFVEVEELEDTTRGSGGFGSSGK